MVLSRKQAEVIKAMQAGYNMIQAYDYPAELTERVYSAMHGLP